MPISVHALIAVRGGPQAKGRFASLLDADERARLTELMFGDMLASLAHAVSIESLWVVTPTRSLAALAARNGCRVVEQREPLGLNSAFVQGITAARGAGAGPVALLPGDLPSLTPGEFDSAAAALATAELVVAPSHDGGTGAVLVRAGIPFTPRFGIDSGRRHVEAACAAGQSVCVLRLPGFDRDLDVPNDALALMRSGSRTASAAFLRDRLAEHVESRSP